MSRREEGNRAEENKKRVFGGGGVVGLVTSPQALRWRGWSGYIPVRTGTGSDYMRILARGASTMIATT